MRNMTSRIKTSFADGIYYVDVWYDIVITRKPNYYISTFMWPSFLITCLSIIGVFSPFNDSGEREEKLTMGLTTLLTMAVILMIITDQMPRSPNTPLLGSCQLKPLSDARGLNGARDRLPRGGLPE